MRQAKETLDSEWDGMRNCPSPFFSISYNIRKDIAEKYVKEIVLLFISKMFGSYDFFLKFAMKIKIK